MDKRENSVKNFSQIQLEVEQEYYNAVIGRYEEIYTLVEEEKADADGIKEKTTIARDTETGRLVIKKNIAREQGKIYERFIGVGHKNVVPVLDVAYRYKMCVVILEYISGITLEQNMKIKGVFSEKEAVNLLSQVAEGLEFIHGFEIIHRDINPANVLISSDGIVKITDLGIARSKKENQSTDTTILGTVGYAAPEQFGFAQTDARTDIYSLGVLLNVLLTGKLPTVLTYNGKLKTVIEKAIKISPQERYQTVAQFRDGMERLSESGRNTNKTYVCEYMKQQGRYIFSTEKTEPDHRKIPGFRTGKLWKKIIACSIYIIMTMFTISLITDTFSKISVSAGLLEIVIMFITFWLPFAIASNWGNWKEKVFPFSKMDRDLIMVIRIIVPLVLFYIGMSLDTWNRS